MENNVVSPAGCTADSRFSGPGHVSEGKNKNKSGVFDHFRPVTRASHPAASSAKVAAETDSGVADRGFQGRKRPSTADERAHLGTRPRSGRGQAEPSHLPDLVQAHPLHPRERRHPHCRGARRNGAGLAAAALRFDPCRGARRSREAGRSRVLRARRRHRSSRAFACRGNPHPSIRGSDRHLRRWRRDPPG